MKYWERAFRARRPSATGRNGFVTFSVDCGGMNNIRMGFEVAVAVAWLTDRALVLPPSEPWYLIDFGQMKTMVERDADDTGKTNMAEFFDIEGLRASGMRVLSAEEFARDDAQQLRFPLPESLANSGNDWKAALERFPSPPGIVQYLIEPPEHVLMWPDVVAVRQGDRYEELVPFIDRRKEREMPKG